MVSLVRSCLAICFIVAWGSASATPSILVDEVHGEPCRAHLQALWPDCQIDAVGPADFPIVAVLASGSAYEEATIAVTVPAGAAMLYGYFECTPVFWQYPLIWVIGPGGALVAEGTSGTFLAVDRVVIEMAVEGRPRPRSIAARSCRDRIESVSRIR